VRHDQNGCQIVSAKKASEISQLVGGLLIGPDIEINGVCSILNPQNGKIGFVTRLTSDVEAALHYKSVLLVESAIPGATTASQIVVQNPRLAFAFVSELFDVAPIAFGVHSSSIIHPTAIVDEEAIIGPFCVIDEGVTICSGAIIENNVTLKKNTYVGQNTRIRSNSVIGGPGFGYEFDSEGKPVHIRHFGRVYIGSNVEIGSCVVIARATIDQTSIGDDVKIDDHVFIAHNVQIGNRTVVIAGTEISGSVQIGEDCWISPQVTIINGVTIGNRALIGIGAVVTKNVPAEKVVAGNPARVLRDRLT
jgi:UDP-3-O-[3-hydroxymyristoyl] glucosamine N-acyltransferase